MTRGRFQGVQQIASYHWRAYAAAAAGMAAALCLPPPWRNAAIAMALPVALWACVSLAVSYYIYDWSAIYGLDWIESNLLRRPEHWANIHAGLDETSIALAELFPQSAGEILDIYDPLEMTEPSIGRARRQAGMQPAGAQPAASPAKWRALPLRSQAIDTAFVIFAAHELRRPDARAQFFREHTGVVFPEDQIMIARQFIDLNFVLRQRSPSQISR